MEDIVYPATIFQVDSSSSTREERILWFCWVGRDVIGMVPLRLSNAVAVVRPLFASFPFKWVSIKTINLIKTVGEERRVRWRWPTLAGTGRLHTYRTEDARRPLSVIPASSNNSIVWGVIHKKKNLLKKLLKNLLKWNFDFQTCLNYSNFFIFSV